MSAQPKRRSGGKAGLGVDALGGPVIDPTENVIALNEAANKRQDDLRDLTLRYLDARLSAIEGEAILRAEYEEKLRVAESVNRNSIRQVDVSAISTLAATSRADAETLRAMVANTASTLAAQLSNTVTAITDRIAQLERASYMGAGKEAVADPQTARLAQLVERLAQGRAGDQGRSAGVSMAWVALLGAVSLVSGLLAIAGVLYAVLKP